MKPSPQSKKRRSNFKPNDHAVSGELGYIFIRRRDGLLRAEVEVDAGRIRELVRMARWHIKANTTRRSRKQRKPKLYVYGDTPEGRRINLAHVVAGRPPTGYVVDHADGNPLNNLRSNLRWLSYAQNAENRDTPKSSTGFRGVRRGCGRKRTYRGVVKSRGKTYLDKAFGTAIEAAKARDDAAIKAWGEAARLNFPNRGRRAS